MRSEPPRVAVASIERFFTPVSNRQSQIRQDESKQTESPESAPMSRGLKLVYILGIALNVVALVATAMEGEWLFTGTFGVIIAYLLLRYWLLDSGSPEATP